MKHEHILWVAVIVLSIGLISLGILFSQQNVELKSVKNILLDLNDLPKTTVSNEAANVNTESEPARKIEYSLGSLPVAVTEKTVSVKDLFDVERLQDQANECGSKHDETYFVDLLKPFQSSNGIQYSFTYTAPSQQDNKYLVTVIPNVMGYKSLEGFKNDFDICGAGATLYPEQINSESLMFVSACGGAGDDSGKPQGCSEIQKALQSTLKLK